jgi:hypothetical protein
LTQSLATQSLERALALALESTKVKIHHNHNHNWYKAMQSA